MCKPETTETKDALIAEDGSHTVHMFSITGVMNGLVSITVWKRWMGMSPAQRGRTVTTSTDIHTLYSLTSVGSGHSESGLPDRSSEELSSLDDLHTLANLVDQH